MLFLKTTCIVIVLGLLGITQGAPVSAQIAYQGILTDASGNPLKDSTWSLTFSLHIDSTGSALPIWTEDKIISTKGGMFSHMLGSVASLVALKFDEQYWLSVKRGDGEIGQRVKLGVVPYAIRAVVADSALTLHDTFKVKYSIHADTANFSRNVLGISEMFSQKADLDHSHDYSKPLNTDFESYSHLKSFMGKRVMSGNFKIDMETELEKRIKLMQYSLPLEGFLHVKLFEIHNLGNTNSARSATYHIQASANAFVAELVGTERAGSGHRESNDPNGYNPSFTPGAIKGILSYNQSIDFVFTGLSNVTYIFIYSFEGI